MDLGDLIDNNPECEMGEPSSNSSHVLYSHLRVNNKGMYLLIFLRRFEETPL